MAGESQGTEEFPNREKVLEILLSAKSDMSRNEPQIAANISEQLQTWVWIPGVFP